MKKRSIDSIALGSEDSSSGEETDDDSEDEKINKNKDGMEGGDEKKDDDGEEPEIMLKKKVKAGKNFSEEMLCGPEGLTRIYEEFPKVFHFRGKGHEANDLARLTRLYKEWAFQLYSGLAFTDLLRSVHTFSTKGQVRTHMAEMRERERDKYMQKVLGVNIAAGERLREKEKQEKKTKKKVNTGDFSDDDRQEDDINTNKNNDSNSNDDSGERAPIIGFDDIDIDIAEIEEMERQAVLASQLSQTKVDINTPPDEEEEEFDFEEAENAMREQEMAEAEAYMAEQEKDSSTNLGGITAQ